MCFVFVVSFCLVPARLCSTFLDLVAVFCVHVKCGSVLCGCVVIAVVILVVAALLTSNGVSMLCCPRSNCVL